MLAIPFGLLAQARGEVFFVERCGSCHGGDATGTDRRPALARRRRLRTRSINEIREIIRNGTPGGMPAFAPRWGTSVGCGIRGLVYWR